MSNKKGPQQPGNAAGPLPILTVINLAMAQFHSE